ncbi:MAG: hypothetical protein OEV44_00350 [Spirochaetota bacterium]|nr:hypothetical protein [Spirochaetota bacterium]
MKEKVLRIESRKLHKFIFTLDGKDHEYHIQEPTFEQLIAANDVLYDNTGNLNLMRAGKVIWELCCVSYDEIIENEPKILMTICNKLSAFALPLDIEIKKK